MNEHINKHSVMTYAVTAGAAVALSSEVTLKFLGVGGV